MADYLRLRKWASAPFRTRNDELLVWAKDDGTLHTRDEGGTDVELGADGNGGAQPWEIVRVPLAYNTAGILTGITVYTPTAGDYVLSATMSITQAWDGTTPQGWLYAAGDDPEAVNFVNQDMTSEDQEQKTGWLEPPDINFPNAGSFGASISDGSTALKFIVTDGAAGNPGSSQGAGELIVFIVKASS